MALPRIKTTVYSASSSGVQKHRAFSVGNSLYVQHGNKDNVYSGVSPLPDGTWRYEGVDTYIYFQTREDAARLVIKQCREAVSKATKIIERKQKIIQELTNELRGQ